MGELTQREEADLSPEVLQKLQELLQQELVVSRPLSEWERLTEQERELARQGQALQRRADSAAVAEQCPGLDKRQRIYRLSADALARLLAEPWKTPWPQWCSEVVAVRVDADCVLVRVHNPEFVWVGEAEPYPIVDVP